MADQPRPRIAEVISIGDEMTSGARLDTNSQWLSQQLGWLGIGTEYHTTVGDSLAANVQVLRTAAVRADVIVLTGGLGPTEDDLTREAIAEASGRPLEFCQAACDRIEDLFAHRGRAMPERNRVQAMFPRGSQPIPNPQGTAPGIDLVWDPLASGQPMDALATMANRSDPKAWDGPGRPVRLFALPGVPAEMQQMWQATVAPRLIAELGAARRRIVQHVVKCFGVGESEMERLLEGLIARDRFPRVGITVSRATISLRITADGNDLDVCQSLIASTRKRIFELAGDYIFGEGDDFELQHAVSEQLGERDESLVVLELGAGGLAGSWLLELPSPGRLLAHLQAPAAEAMAALLGVSGGETADFLSAACKRTGADWAMLIDSYPGIVESDQPLPAHRFEVMVYRATDRSLQRSTPSLGGHPDIIKARIAKAGLDFLRRCLLAAPPWQQSASTDASPQPPKHA